ncbi:MAG: hypothetical protein A2901_07545 [Elusimicrobia bacterium RIFCSPLOWO2_01_FULL_54_10]|nr:MAG: hypothetical protein A2901_07545 [Elusimicrobia bacterium RIFCSPLOWO2_01_FULL_54_10]
MNSAQAKAYLDRIASRGMNPGLARMEKLMEIMGRPEKKFKCVHITGSNGKGSTSAMLESVLRHAGIRTGMYTSPHLIDLTERITLAGRAISWKSLADWIGKIRERAGRMEKDVTYFEVVTAAAFCAFAQARVELAVVEVGLGARFDATNVLPAPEAALITNISLEHTRYLGKTVESIAWEKSHIIKPGTICVTGTSGDALKIVRTACARAGAKLHVTTSCAPSVWKKFHPSLTGDFQKMNLALVLKTIEVLKGRGWKIPLRAVLRGLNRAVWPGRFQWKSFRKTPVLLDGAHNPGAMDALTASLRKSSFGSRPCRLVFNALDDKNVREMAGTLLSQIPVKDVFIPRLPTERSCNPDDIRRIFHSIRPNLPVATFSSVQGAWSSLKSSAIPGTDWIMATGSFYTVGETMRVLK